MLHDGTRGIPLVALVEGIKVEVQPKDQDCTRATEKSCCPGVCGGAMAIQKTRRATRKTARAALAEGGAGAVREGTCGAPLAATSSAGPGSDL